jgi:hypothetical protein
MKKNLLLSTICLLLSLQLWAQKDTSSLLSDLVDATPETEYAQYAFKTNRIINLHSLENTAAGVMDFKISHRFGVLSQGVYDLFGLDEATQRFGLDFGLTNNLQVGIHRNSSYKAYDLYAKYRILRQSTGKIEMPITLSVFGSAAVETVKQASTDGSFANKLIYTTQLIVGRKFNDVFTLQLSPTLVHRNIVLTAAEKNDVFALGIGGRVRLSRRLALNAEYIYVPNNQLASNYSNALSIGLDIETGGHVFQLHFTNSDSMAEYAYTTKTSGKWSDGDIRFGFNVSRVTLWNPKK